MDGICPSYFVKYGYLIFLFGLYGYSDPIYYLIGGISHEWKNAKVSGGPFVIIYFYQNIIIRYLVLKI